MSPDIRTLSMNHQITECTGAAPSHLDWATALLLMPVKTEEASAEEDDHFRDADQDAADA